MRPRGGAAWPATLVASIAVAAPAAASVLTPDVAAPAGGGRAVVTDSVATTQAGVRRRYVPRVRLSVALLKNGKTRITKLRVEDAPADALVRLACSGGGCPSAEELALNPPQPGAFGGVMVGRRLSAGARLEVRTSLTRNLGPVGGPVLPLQLEYTTRFLMRRGALPRRADRCSGTLTQGSCIDPAVIGLFRVDGAVTKITRLAVTGVPLADTFRVNCRGRSCALVDWTYQETPRGVHWNDAFRGVPLRPGTRITAGYVTLDQLTYFVPGFDLVRLTSCSATQWTTRRGRAPRRVDIGPYEGEDPDAVRAACRAPFP